MQTNFGQLFLQGGWVMWPLLVFSVITWAVILERTFVLVTLRPKLNRLGQTLLQSLKSGDAQTAKQILHAQKPQVAEVFLTIFDHKNTKESSERMTERSRMRLTSYLKRNLWILATVASASPFIGLLGTVVGIVRTFHDMQEKGAGGFSVVGGGISEALIATAAGLIVAIISLITYNIFLTSVNQTMQSIKLTLEELLDLSYESKSV